NIMEVVDGSAPPLGMFVKASDSFAHSSLRLSPGDRAFLYTDGLSESRDAEGQLLGTEGVSRFLLSRAQTPLPELSAELEAFLLERNSKINDDVTLIGVEYDPDQD
ncbi:MAG: PP2C family protein-serine/threonine phosphatase, partial [Oceanococcaceae bacterium]